MEVLKRFFRIKESGILFALIVMCVGLSVTTSTFLTQYNLGVVIRQASFVAIVALGETLVLLIGGIDLSVGYIAGLCSILGCLLMTATNIDPYICTLITLLFGLLFGTISGLFIAKMKLNPFIVTLAMGEVFAGAILVVTKGYPVLNLPKKFTVLGQGMVGPVPIPVIIMIVLAAIMAYILRNTPFGRNIYAIGGNQAAARLVGISVEKIKVSVYAISGMLASLAGMLFASRVNAGQPTTGAAWLMPTITAAIIGGTSLSGGEGTIVGTILGAIFMGILANGIVLLDISAYWERVIIGAVVLIAVIMDILRSRKK